MDVDLNKPVENPKLKELLKQRAVTPQAEQVPLLNLIAEEFAMNANLLAVVDLSEASIEPKGEGKGEIKGGSNISFPMLGLKDGTAIQPFFTDWEELRKWETFKEGDVKTMVMSFEDVYSILANNKYNLVINPFGDALLLPFSMVEQFKSVKESMTATHIEQNIVKKDTKVMLGEPKDYPRQMTDAICKYAKNVKDINAIWLKLMMKDEEQSFLLVVDAKGDPRTYFQDIANAGIPYLPKGMYIDLVPITQEFGIKAATGEPFYKRKKGLFG